MERGTRTPPTSAISPEVGARIVTSGGLLAVREDLVPMGEVVRWLLWHSSVSAAAHHLDGVGQDAGIASRALANRPGTAGQIDDQCSAANSRDAARQDGVGRLLRPSAASVRPSPGRAVADRAVASGVTSRGPRPVPPVVNTRSQAIHRPADELPDNRLPVVRHDALAPISYAAARQDLPDGRPADVLPPPWHNCH